MIIFILLIALAHSYTETAPQWLTSDYFRAGNQNVIATLTGSSQTPTYTFTFSSPLPGVPSLAYGIKNYMGNDYMGQQIFQIRREELTASTFTVSVQIYGVTNIYILNVPYIAIDPQFPHHLNSFDNVPVNYNAGSLTNITSRSTTQVLTYTNVINYTVQAASRTFKRFNPPLENNQIILFICALEIRSTLEGSSLPWYPINYFVESRVLSEETYELKVTLSNKTQINWLHFSQIILDLIDVQSSEKYYIVTEKLDIPNQGMFIPLEEAFVDNFILGLIDFSTLRGHSVLHYNWDFKIEDGVFGIHVNQSIPYPHLVQSALDRMGTRIFYIKTFRCPDGYQFFNMTTNLCQDMCGDYFFQIFSDYECDNCNYSCQDCTSGTDCLICDAEHDHRILFNGVSCECMENYYEDPVTTVCQHCTNQLQNCADCFYNSSYSASDASSGAIQFGCFECQPGYYLDGLNCVPPVTCNGPFVVNYDDNTCQACNMAGCTECQTHTVCDACDEANNYFLDLILQCVVCPVYGCDICSSLNSCQICDPSFTIYIGTCFCQKGTYLDVTNEICPDCSPFCRYCTGPSAFECTACVENQNRFLVGTTCVCDPYNYKQPESGETCVQIDPSKCNRGFIKIETTGQCVEICGDGVLMKKECDDGNIINNDGCSDQCIIENHYVCSDEWMEMSVCKLDAEVEFQKINIEKYTDKNKLKIILGITPKTDAYKNYRLKEIIEFSNPNITLESFTYDDGNFYIQASYNDHLAGEEVTLQIKESQILVPGHMDDPNAETIFNTDKPTFKLSSSFTIETDNNLDSNYYSEEVYAEAKTMADITTAVCITAIVISIVSLLLKNSFPIIMTITNLQIIYLSLASIDGMHPVTSSLNNLKNTFGYNDPELIPNNEAQALNTRIGAMGYDTSFANNFNVMLICQLTVLIISGFLYLIAQKKKIMNKAFKVCQRETFLFIVFNLNNLFFSISMMRQATFFNILFASFASFVAVIQIIHFLVYADQYFGMKDTFNFEKVYLKVFFFGFLFARIGVCFCLVLIQDSLLSAIIALSFQACFVILIAIVRPFNSMISNVIILACQMMTLGAFSSIYVFEGLDGIESTGGWVLLGLGAVTCSLGFTHIIFSIYEMCKSSAKVNKILPLRSENSIEKLK